MLRVLEVALEITIAATQREIASDYFLKILPLPSWEKGREGISSCEQTKVRSETMPNQRQ